MEKVRYGNGHSGDLQVLDNHGIHELNSYINPYHTDVCHVPMC